MKENTTANEIYGYNGKMLMVDLTSRQSHWEAIPEDVLKKFIGGSGLGAYLLHKLCPTGIDALEPANPLIFVTSPLVGSRLTTSSKFAVVTKSPLTGFIGDSLSSSFMATELKKTGCDALVITGKSELPCLLSIDDGHVEFLEAHDLMGKTTSETEKAVKERMGHRTRVACIGPAGEKLVRFASITNDGGRQAARTGPGAVMGSKNLKAISVKGTHVVPVQDPDALNIIGDDLTQRSLGPATEKYRTLGTMANVSVFNRLGTLPTRNFQQSTFDEAESVTGEAMHQAHFVKNAHCANCTIGCEKILVTNDDGKKAQGRMEYESAFALGPLVGVADSNTVIRASTLCDELGMDTISTGVTLAWAMECSDKGLLTPDQTGGFSLSFGDGDALLEGIKLIAERRGIGNLLAEGSMRASRKVGQGSEAWAMQVKGLEMPGYEPRSLKTMALGLAVSTRGACHNRSSAYEADFSDRVDRLKVDDQRGRITAEGEDFSAVLDSLIWCKFLRKAFSNLYEESAEIYQKITGWPTSADELRKAGERINNLKKLFNIREGWTREDDTLPERVFTETLPTGMVAGVGLEREDLQMMVQGYYRARGWTEDGMIPDEKLRELGLTELSETIVPSS
ncbi:MAG: aldehyde ferredoxin oxidoreductase family protein [Chloroflexi bacterium]|nr:aldehyde ferredoxin oxidoreductase family protein [Chloroflexota bacterium]MDA1226437.1 aldehyde ferredoxin oxidoreductase family protein [Chloroflexota bacterium]